MACAQRRGDPCADRRVGLTMRGLVHPIDLTVSGKARYGQTCYAVFFADPDGLKPEYVFGATGA